MVATIRAVAEAAGVSITTVSFVLNNKKPQVDAIPKDTRDRVKACALSLGYRRNPAAASLRTGRSLWIGVVMQPLRDEQDAYMWAPYELALLSGVQNSLLENGYFPVLGSKSTTGDTESLDRLVSSGVGGLIYRRPLREEVWRMQELRDDGIASIAVFPAHKEDLYPHNIDMDNVKAGQMAGELFMRAGKQKPMYVINEIHRQMDLDRARGFSEVVERELNAPPIECYLPASLGDVARIEAMAELIRETQPDCVMATEAGNSFLVTFAAEKLNLKVPDELCIIGFDCYSFRSARDQTVSAVGVSWWRAGQLAADSIVEMIRNRTEWTVPKKLGPRFIPGDTTPPGLAKESDLYWLF